MACQDEKVLRVAAHSGGQVIHVEQVPQPFRILLTLLKIINVLDKPFDKGLTPAG